MDNCDFFLQFV